MTPDHNGSRHGRTDHRKRALDELEFSRSAVDGSSSIAAGLRAIGHALLCAVDGNAASNFGGDFPATPMQTRPAALSVQIRDAREADYARTLAAQAIVNARHAAFKARNSHGSALPPVATDDEVGPESWPL